jgi:hypothetical protein
MQKEVQNNKVNQLRHGIRKEFNGWAVYSSVAVLFVITVLGLTWLLQGGDFFLYRYFAPKYEEARRETFEESKAYNQGMAQDVQRMMFEYVQAPEDKKAALSSIILHRVADYDTRKLSPDLQVFLDKLRQGQLN